MNLISFWFSISFPPLNDIFPELHNGSMDFAPFQDHSGWDPQGFPHLGCTSLQVLGEGGRDGTASSPFYLRVWRHVILNLAKADTDQVFIDPVLVKHSNSLLSILPIHGLLDTSKWAQSKSHNNWGLFWAEEMLVDKFPWFYFWIMLLDQGTADSMADEVIRVSLCCLWSAECSFMQVYEVNVLLSKPFTVAIIHLFFFPLLFSSQPSARTVYCIQMIAVVLSWGTNNSRAGFISKEHPRSMAMSDSFMAKLVSVQFT